MAATSSVVRRTPSSSSLYDVLDLILDKGLVIDAYVRVSLVGIEILTIDLRIVIASVDTYLRFAEAVDRLVLEDKSKSLPEFAESMTRGVAREDRRRDRGREGIGRRDGRPRQGEGQGRRRSRRRRSGGAGSR